jgi:hypothetical protein
VAWAWYLPSKPIIMARIPARSEFGRVLSSFYFSKLTEAFIRLLEQSKEKHFFFSHFPHLSYWKNFTEQRNSV